ncbi:MAG: lipocalin-like domain-containing protein, partial [Halanaerobium sp.]
NDWYDAEGELKIPKNQWVHLAAAVDQGEISFFINGEEHFSGSEFPDIFSDLDANFALGVNYWDAPFEGKIDDLRIYEKALSAEEISELAAGAEEIAADEPKEKTEVAVPLDKKSVSVHDPMIIKEDGTYYVFGSHLAAAKSEDLVEWKQIASDWDTSNPIIPDPESELKEALKWPDPDAESTWAKSPIKIKAKNSDQYHLYFSTANWESERSTISLAKADRIEGPYEFDKILLRKYEEGNYSHEAGENFSHMEHPGVIDPHVFYDKNDRLWMLYGSYAGGFHILEMDEETGYPENYDPESGYVEEGSGYGKRIAGGGHSPMEGSYILYNPETDYYYLYMSFGTLAADGGYNIRVARSKSVEGPYLDSAGVDMREYDNDSWEDAENYGTKLIGNFIFKKSELGYLSPGHNSAFYDQDSGRSFVIFHTRYPGQGESHQVRVHQTVFNQKDWPVITPHSYRGESLSSYSEAEVTGSYQFVNHGRDIQNGENEINYSQEIKLNPDGSLSGDQDGSWKLVDDYYAEITVAEEKYYGAFIKQYDRGLEKEVMTFSALSDKGVTIWGSGY